MMRVLIADDHTLFRDSLRTLLEAHDIEVVGEAADGRQAFRLTQQLRPDIVLMDLSMPEVGGLEATRQITEQIGDVKVIVLTASEDDHDLFEALKAGAQGYLLKNMDASRFLGLLNNTASGEPALSPSLARKVLREFARGPKPSSPDDLTDRETEVLRLMIDGVTSNRKLARQLGVSENTVKFHVRNILDKLHLHSRAQAVGYALRNRLVEPSP
jgi:DNA-binding NarL/FixJ family response regulator